jgi:hypothetical protein
LGGDVDIPVIKDTSCKTCPYFPTCDSSIYTYSDTTTGAPATRIDTIFFIKDSTIKGLTFRKVFLTGRNQVSFINCSNGDTRQIVPDTIKIATFSATNVELILLKANLPVGGIWTDTVTLNSGQTALFKNKIVAKNISRTVNSIVYPDVIRTQTDIGITLPFVGFTVIASSNTYFAKNVGIIETDIVNVITGQKIIHSVLLSSVIP